MYCSSVKIWMNDITYVQFGYCDNISFFEVTSFGLRTPADPVITKSKIRFLEDGIISLIYSNQ